VFVTHYPAALKPFYMRASEGGGGTVENFDLLVPGGGELAGGSAREHRHDVLAAAMAKRGLLSRGVVEALAARLRAAPGRALLIDYGPADSEAGDSLQAVSKHRKVDPLADPGGADLTAHVDFGAVGRLSLQAGLAVYGAIPQAVFLEALGLSARAARLKASAPERSDVIDRQHARLAGADEMGVLFKALCLTTPDLSPPAGFSPT
jgi:SAM-dependent MidA family methyltransferase